MVAFNERNKKKFFRSYKLNKFCFKKHILVDNMNNYVFNFIIVSDKENKNLIIKEKKHFYLLRI